MNSEKTSRGITAVLFAAERVQSYFGSPLRVLVLWRGWLVCCQQFRFFPAGAEAGPQVVAISDGTSKTSRTGT